MIAKDQDAIQAKSLHNWAKAGDVDKIDLRSCPSLAFKENKRIWYFDCKPFILSILPACKFTSKEIGSRLLQILLQSQADYCHLDEFEFNQGD